MFAKQTLQPAKTVLNNCSYQLSACQKNSFFQVILFPSYISTFRKSYQEEMFYANLVFWI